jgi:hypothetical protein
MICGTFTTTSVPGDQLADVMQEFQDNVPPPINVTSSPDGKGTFTVVATFQPCTSNTSHDAAAAAAPPATPATPAAPAAAGAGVGGNAPSPAQQSNGSLKGFDAAFDCSHILSKAKTVGVKFVCRYYSHSTSKNLSPAEARLISSSGISIVTVWETLGDNYAFFSFTQGVDDATSASNMAQTIGQPTDSTIYFAVDFDASGDQIGANVGAYFKGVRQGLTAAMPGKPTYAIGVYGSGLTCSTLVNTGLVDHTWLACSNGWRGSKDYNTWNIKQSLPSDPWGFGTDIDPDIATDASGSFTVPVGGALAQNF